MSAPRWRRLRRIAAAWQRYEADDGPTLAAAVAYYLGLSLFPLLLVLIAGLGWFLQFTETGRSAEEQFLSILGEQLSPTLVLEVQQTLHLVRARSHYQGPIGFLVVLLTSLAAFGQFDRALDRIWRLAAPPEETWWRSALRLLRDRGVAFLMLLATGLFLVLVVVTGVATANVRESLQNLVPVPESFWRIPHLAVSFLLNVLLLLAIYRWLPKQRPGWRAAAGGAVFAAVLWEIGRQLLGAFLGYVQYSSAYGIVGSFLAILLWCYYAVSIVLLGAEYAWQLQEERRTAG
jgi:membrane protein